MLPSAMYRVSINQHSVTIQWECVGALTSTALSLQTPAQGENQIAVDIIKKTINTLKFILFLYFYTCADEVINNVAASIISDDEDDETDEDDSTEGSADNQLVF